MIDRKEIELLIRAQLKGGKDLESITKSIGELEAAIDSQASAAKRGESSVDELKASLEALRTVQRDLESKGNLVGNFQRLGDAVKRAEDRVGKAQEKFDKYNKEVSANAKLTEDQQKKLDRYSAALDKANVALQKQQERHRTSTDALREAGIATNELANAEDRIRKSAVTLGTAFQKVQGAITTYTQDLREARDTERAMADDRAFQKKLEDATKLAKSADYVQFWTDALNKADDAERRLQDDNTFQKKLTDAANLAKTTDYVRWWTDAMEKADAAQEELQKTKVRQNADAGLKKMADEAEVATSKLTSLAQASANLTPKQNTLRDALNGIINPAQKMRSTLAGVEQEVNDLSSAIDKIKGPVNDYRSRVDALAAAQKSLVQQAGLIDDFRKQEEALRGARAEYTAARAEVAQYAAAVRQGGEAGQAFTKSLAEAQARARGASQVYANQLAVQRQSAEALRAAGISTKNLAGETERLTKTARTAVSATLSLATAVKKYGVESENAARSKNPFSGDGGRTTLSFLQRIRGEVLALTTAYVGLFGVIRTAQGSIEATQTREGARNALSLAVGNDRKAIDDEYNYVKAQSDRIGLEFDRAIKGYAKFAASASMAGRSREEIRFIYESFAEVSRVANLSADDLDGVFKALEQIFSKGKIQAEELRGQLGDRLFGAFQVAAKALEKQFPDLNKAMEKGLVTSDQLVLVANKYRETIADQLPAATQSLAAQQARLNNALFDFQLAIGDSGFIDAYKDAVVEVTKFMRSTEGQNAATMIGKGFQAAAEAVIYLLQNLETVKTVLQGIGIYFGIALGVSMVRQILAGVDAAKKLWVVMSEGVAVVTKFAKAWPLLFSAIKVGLGVITAAFAGWEFGKWLNENSELVRKFGVALITGFAELWATLKGGFQVAIAAFPVIVDNAFRAVYNTISGFVRKGLSLFSLFAKAAGADELANSIDSLGASLKMGYVDLGAATEQARKKMAEEVANIRGIRDDMMKAAERLPTALPVSKAGAGRGFVNPALVQGTTRFPGRSGGGGGSGASDAELNKRANKIEEIRKALETLDARIDRSQTESLKSQLSAIDNQYAALSRKIKELGGKESKEFMVSLTKLTNELRTVTINKFNDDMLKERSALLDKIEGLEANAGRRDKLSLESRQNAIRIQYADLYRDLAEMRLKAFNNDMDTSEIDAAKKRVDEGIEELLQLEAKKVAQEEINREQERFNKLIQVRDAQIAAERARAEANPDQADAVSKNINDINEKFIPAVELATQKLLEMAAARRASFASEEDYQLFIANLEAIRLKTTQVTQEFTRMEQAVVTGSINGINTGLNTMFDALEQVATGQATVSEGFRGMLVSAAQFAASFLRDIAIMIIKLAFFNALAGMGGYAGMIGRAGQASMGVKHSGGVIGGTSNGRTRRADPMWFANATRYHSGGVPGLASDEYATILQRGEEVLAKNSPRNIMNGGAGVGGSGGSTPMSLNATIVDSRDSVPQAMATPAGNTVILEALRSNVATVKAILGG